MPVAPLPQVVTNKNDPIHSQMSIWSNATPTDNHSSADKGLKSGMGAYVAKDEAVAKVSVLPPYFISILSFSHSIWSSLPRLSSPQSCPLHTQGMGSLTEWYDTPRWQSIIAQVKEGWKRKVLMAASYAEQGPPIWQSEKMVDWESTQK